MPGAETKHKVRDVTVRMLRGGSGPPLLFLHGANGLDAVELFATEVMPRLKN